MKKISKKCFVMMPFAGEFKDVYSMAIKPAAEKNGLQCFRIDELKGVFNITRAIMESIFSADIIIVDLTNFKPNVFYELGIAHALAKKVIMIAQQGERLPFDVANYRIIFYENTRNGIIKFIEVLSKTIKYFLQSDIPIESPVIESIPEAINIPFSELKAAKDRIGELEAELKNKEKEIRQLKSIAPVSDENKALFQSLKDFLKSSIDDITNTNLKKVSILEIENQKLKYENNQLQSARDELSRLKNYVIVNPHWKGRNFQIDEKLCFLLMPFKEPWSDDVWKLLEDIVTDCGYKCQRADEKDGRVVMDDIWEGIYKAKIIIADLTSKNANVAYEVGLADVLGKDVILISQTPDDIPFDFLGIRLITYENSIKGARELRGNLKRRLTTIN